MNSLTNYINQCISEHPTLFRDIDFKSSRLKVLDHLFLAYGTGCEWGVDGTIYDQVITRRSRRLVPAKKVVLPPDYFSKELYTFHCQPDDLPRVKAFLDKKKKYYHLATRASTIDYTHGIVFESNLETAGILHRKFQNRFFSKFGDLPKETIKNILSKMYFGRNTSPLEPHQICRYSPIVEMTNGQTDSPHIDNFKLKAAPEWLEGAKEIVKECLEFYSNSERFKKSIQYNSTFKGKRTWPEHKEEQVALLTGFMDKFGD